MRSEFSKFDIFEIDNSITFNFRDENKKESGSSISGPVLWRPHPYLKRSF